MQPGARLRGRVVFDDLDRPLSGTQLLSVPVFVLPARGRNLGVIPATRLEVDGSFTTAGLPPGEYAVLIYFPALGPSFSALSVESLRVGDQDIVGRSIEVGTSDVDVTITVMRPQQRPTITGTVRTSKGVPSSDARVILFARNPEMRGVGVLAAPTCVLRLVPDRLGRFQGWGRSACDYLAVAVANPPQLWTAPDYLESLARFAVPVRLGPNGVVDLVVRDVPP